MKKKIFYIFAAIVVFLITQTIFALTTTDPKTALAHHLNSFTTMQMQFVEKTLDKNGGRISTERGEMMIWRPGRFRFVTRSPGEQIVIANGNKVWVYDVDLQQATEQTLSQRAFNPANLLSGNADEILKQFLIAMEAHGNTIVFHLSPISADMQIESVTIEFTDGVLSKMIVQQNAALSHEFDFVDVKTNVTFPSNLFEFHAPEGVNVLR